MSQSSALLHFLEQGLAEQVQSGSTEIDLDQPLPSHAPDFFSNNYLSLSNDHFVKEAFLRKLKSAPTGRLLGSTGSRLSTGGSDELNALEKAFQRFFGAQSALVFPSGFNANLTFFATIPQKHDVIIHDELIHPSSRVGMTLSPCKTTYRFANNSIPSFKKCLLGVLQSHPEVTRGSSTVFVAVESLYSMDGIFCPLKEIVELVESLVPAGHSHIVIDEAHASGICGPNGTGYVKHLGLSDRVHTKIHTLGKGWGFRGAIILSAPTVWDYLTHFGKAVIFTTAMPYTDIYALESCLETISGERGNELRARLYHLSRYARQKMFTSLGSIPETIFKLKNPSGAVGPSDPTICSPIIPVYSRHAGSLADHLLRKGYPASAITYPIVKTPRVRITIHAHNTEEEIDALVHEILVWVERQKQVLASARDARSSARVGFLGEKEKARL